jgi:hypothetical protein
MPMAHSRGKVRPACGKAGNVLAAEIGGADGEANGLCLDSRSPRTHDARMDLPKVPALLLALAFTASPLLADRTLEIKEAQKQEIQHGMMGLRNTLLIYKFNQQKAVLIVLIDNKDDTFPITATIHLFARTTSGEGIDKWINNQHSDALFPDVPEPVFTQRLPKEACTITSKKKGDNGGDPPSVNPTDEKVFEVYEVGFAVKEQRADKQFVLPAFDANTKVHVEAKP